MSSLEKQIKGPDAFQTTVTKGFDAVEKNRSLIFIFIGVLFAAGAGYSAFSWWSGRKEIAAQEALYLAKKAIDDRMASFEKTKSDKAAAEAAKKDKKSAPVAAVSGPEKSGDFETDFGPQLTELKKAIEAHKGTLAAIQGAIEASAIYEEYKKPDEAIGLLEAAKKSSAPALFQTLLNMRLGDMQQLKGDCSTAVQTWTQIINDKSMSFLHADALLKQALCLESAGDKNKALETYRKLTQDHGDTDAGKAAKKYLLILEAAG